MTGNAENSVADTGTIVRWLTIVAALTGFMVLLGGVTRLTESGLSMVDWNPVTGWLPPLTDAGWAAEFTKYQRSPQFQQVNNFFTVADFKTIFWFEYLHRLLGRIIGVSFAFPFFWWLLKKKIPSSLTLHLWIIVGLIGVQGYMGIYMVRSGLIDEPSVSQYRLAAHLGLAFIIFGYLIWLILGLIRPIAGRLGGFTIGLTGLIFLQILGGALVAGLDAGFIYNTWPLIDEAIISPDILTNPPFWPGLFEDTRLVQFNHRMIAYLIAGLVVLYWWRHRGEGRAVNGLALVMLYQMVAGILTVLYLPYIPAWLAVFHQAGGLALFGVTVWNLHQIRRS
jgi:heme a synthase